MKGRPLRFLGGVLAGWVGVRVVLLWPTAPTLPALIRAVAPPLAAAERAIPVAASVGSVVAASVPAPVRASGPDPYRITLALAALVGFGRETPVGGEEEAQAVAAPPARLPPPLVPVPLPAPGSRLSGSAWGIARGGAGDVVPGGQLGGSQAGVRVAYALTNDRRVALAGRVSAPLEGRGAEAALGVEWRPLDAPVRLIAEQRVALDGGRGGPTVMAVAGLPPTRVGAWTLEAYGQAGAIARGKVAGFADGAARLTRPVMAVDVGLGAWGGVQSGVARVDVGPSVGMVLPVGGRRIRLTADWRVRVAGRARPGSGPALSIGTDF